MRKLSQIWFEVQEVLFPFIEKEAQEPFTEKLKQFFTMPWDGTRKKDGTSFIF